MEPTPGRRELNKQRTRRRIRRSAMQLFAAHGFDGVTTLHVAEAAEVSPATVYNYFPTKEDLFFGQVEELETRLTELVTAVPAGASILTALQGHVLYELTAGRATTDPPAVASFHSILADSPSLKAREAEIYERRVTTLTSALVATGQDKLAAAVAAREYVAAEQLIAAELRRRLAGSASPRRILRDLEGLIDRVFGLIRTGVGDLTPAASPPRRR
jgi:AcrR family transcriptional regulator